MKINVIGGTMDPREVDQYIEYARKKHVGRQISGMDIIIDGEYVDLKFYFSDTDFQHAYRSADYLVKSMDKLNDAKQSEFREKHTHKVDK